MSSATPIARKVRIELSQQGRQLCLSVCDDGVGLSDAQWAREGQFGLLGMRERVEALGGSFDLGTPAEGGTCVQVCVPMEPGDAPVARCTARHCPQTHAAAGAGRTQETGAMNTPLNILVVDDHAIVREGLKRILENRSPDWRVTEAADGHAALERLRQQHFDVAVVDLSMPGMSGLELLRRMRPQWPGLRVLVLSMHAEEAYAVRAFKAGAHGYVTKDCVTQELALAVSKVAAGGAYVTPAVAECMVLQMGGAQEPSSLSQLSDRELDVLRRMVAGQRPTDIAKDLHLSIKTISTHKSRILARLQLPNLAALVRFGLEQGLATEASHTQPDHV